MAITSRVIAGSDPKMKKSKKFSTKIILKVKNLSINLVLFGRENFQNLKVIEKFYTKTKFTFTLRLLFFTLVFSFSFLDLN